MPHGHLAVVLIPALLALASHAGERPQAPRSPVEANHGPGKYRAIGSGLQPEAGGTIAGTVTVSGSGTPIQGLRIEVYDSNGAYFSFYTDSTGTYSAAGLQPGSYHVRTQNTDGYLDELYDDIFCPGFCSVTSGTPIGVAAGATTSGIDFALEIGGRVAGTVVASGSGTPLEGVGVDLHDSTGLFVSYGITDASGSYTTNAGLPPGTYYALTSNSYGYVDELYDDASCPGKNCPLTSGVPLSVTAGATTSGIDFELDLGGRIAGNVAAHGSGSPIPNVFVMVYDSTGAALAAGFTDSAGSYLTSDALPPGSYYARTGNSAGYIDELYDDIACVGGCSVTSGTPISLAAGATTSGIDFALEAPLSFWRAHGLTTVGEERWASVANPRAGPAHSGALDALARGPRHSAPHR